MAARARKTNNWTHVGNCFEDLVFLTEAVRDDITQQNTTLEGPAKGLEAYTATEETVPYLTHSPAVKSGSVLRKDDSRREEAREWLHDVYTGGAAFNANSRTVTVVELAYAPALTYTQERVRAYANQIGELEKVTGLIGRKNVHRSKLFVKCVQAGKLMVFNIINDFHALVGNYSAKREAKLASTPAVLTILDGYPTRDSLRQWFAAAGLPVMV